MIKVLILWLLLVNISFSAGLTSPTLATNPHGVADYASSVPFIDLMKQARPWFAGGSTPREWEYLNDNGHLDENGWPLTIPEGSDSIQTLWDWPEGHGSYNANQSYKVTWSGEATVLLTGAIENVVSVDANTITFNFNSSGGFLGLIIKSMSAAPNNPRDIRIIRDDLEELYDAGHRINPDYARFLQDMRLLRFMDWGQTNNSPQVNWSDRATTADVTYSTETGVPIEHQIELCNLVKADCWFNFPHKFTDEAVEAMVTYVRDNLDKKLKAFYELSNEVWNAGTFNHQAYFLSKSREEWPNAAGEADFEVALNYYAKRSVEVFEIVDAVYKGILPRRVNVLGSLNDDNDFIHQAVMNANIWKAQDSVNYKKPSQVAQAITIAPYYGVEMQLNHDAEIQAQFDAGTHIDWIYDYLSNPSNGDSVPNLIKNIGVAKTAATAEGLELIMYEGLRHYLHGGFAQEDVLNALLEFSRHTKDAELVQEVWKAWEKVGDGPLMVFSDIGGHSAFGAWTLAEFYGDSSPYSEMLIELNNSSEQWWGDNRDFSNGEILGSKDYSKN